MKFNTTNFNAEAKLSLSRNLAPRNLPPIWYIDIIVLYEK